MNSIKDKTDNFFSNFPLVSLSKGEIIYRPDQQITDIYYIKTGKVRMYSISDEGDEATLHIFRSSAYLPIMLLLSNGTNKYFFEVIDTIHANKAPAENVISFIKSEPDVLYDLTSRFSDAICGLLTRTESLIFDDAYTKIVQLLLYLCEKFGTNENGNVVVTISLSHEDISNWIGIRRETVTRQFEKLQKNNLIKIENKHFVLLDIDKLRSSIKTTS